MATSQQYRLLNIYQKSCDSVYASSFSFSAT